MLSSLTKRAGLNSESIQEYNRALVLRHLRKVDICSRADLAKIVGLERATITNIINNFLEWGLVKETGIIEGQKGRRSIGISLNADKYNVIGVRLARNYVGLGVFDISGTEIEELRKNISIKAGTTTAIQTIKETITEYLSHSGDTTTLGIGFALPGPFIREEGRIALMTEFPGWERVQIKKEFESTFNVPVYFEHDANAGAIAEWWFGPYSHEQGTLLYVAAGQGIGAGIILDGRLMRGAMGTAGEIGHMSIDYKGPKCSCGNIGCLEHYCSTLSIIKNVNKHMGEENGSPPLSFNNIVKRIEQDAFIKKAVIEAARYLGLGLANLINVINPNVIIIGDDLSTAGEIVLNTIDGTVKDRILPELYNSLRIELSSFTEDPVLLGISTFVIDKTFQHPSVLQNLVV